MPFFSNIAQYSITGRRTMMLILIIIVFTLLFYVLCLKPFNYWKNRGVSQYNCWVSLRETLLGFIPYRAITEGIEKTYNDFSKERYCGVYQFFKPALFIKDPELIKQLTVKDFDYFVDHDQIMLEDTEPMWEKNLFLLRGDKWKDMRATLSPSFTSSKMKMMFGLITEYAKKFVEYFEEQPGTIVLEFKDTFTRFTNDVIATTAFGINCDSIRNPNNEFYLIGKELTNFSGFKKNIKILFLVLFPWIAKQMGIGIFTKNIRTFFSHLVRENMKSREKNAVVRPDMIHLLMEARKNRLSNELEVESDREKIVKRQLTDNDITAQALSFFFGGFDSVSTMMCFMAHELAVNVNVQERLQKEIDETFANCEGSVTYDALSKMLYMDMVVSESLRKWPAAVIVDRVCVKPYTIQPVADCEKPLQVDKGQVLYLPIFGLHRDETYFSDPECFDPERFNEDNKNKINPYAYIPFGVGPRSCIGNRFALMEIKLAFFYLLTKFNIVVVDKTTIPLKIAKSAFQLSAHGGFWLGLEPRNLS